MNINMLSDTDNDPGFYAAATGPAGWHSATLLKSIDGGANWITMASLTSKCVIGTVPDSAVLANWDWFTNHVDEVTRFTVNLTDPSSELTSTTYAGLIDGAQVAVVGDEIIYFRDAVLNTDGSYTISGLLRGRRGSEYAVDTHVNGERFVLVSGLTRIPGSTSDIGIERLYVAVTTGNDISLAAHHPFTNQGCGLKPYACVQLGAGRNGSGDLIMQWIRRSRISGEWRDGVDVPLGETSEAYEVDILDGSLNTVRTISGLSTPTATYTAAQQTADFGSPQSNISWRVYQLSSVIGRGHAAYAYNT